MLEVARYPSPPGSREAPMETAYDGRQVVGMDLHRRRSVLVRMTEDGRRLGTARITNSPAGLRREIAKAGESPRGGPGGQDGGDLGAAHLAPAGAGGAPGATPGGEGVHLPPGEKDQP